MSRGEPGKSTATLSVDTGGTFTDILFLQEGRLTALKIPSTPDDPSQAVLSGIAQILEAGDAGLYVLVHGSTVATNAILEGKGARVYLVTNQGFEDVVEIGRQNRPQLYALTGHRRPPLVARADRIGVPGRMDRDGMELHPMEPDALAALPDRLRDAEAVAVVLLHSYANPEHERAVERALASLEVPVSLSSRILPEFREFERTSTTVANAYVAPLMEAYLTRLGEGVDASGIRVMGSGGGALPLVRAIAEPVHTVLSGPAGGVVAARDWGQRCGTDHLLSFDMGGTSTDVSLVPGGLLHTTEGGVGAVPISVSLIDIHTVGAGGGSIAQVDPGGALKVGPESAGAIPGPIVYGRGGVQPTVTDAHVWLGRLPSEGLLGGGMGLDRSALVRPMETLAQEAGITPDAVAEGILDVVNAAMERALRVISVERGYDPREFHLLAFGGAGGLHAVELAERMGLRGVVIPPDPGLLSAYGMLVAPVVRERSRTVFLSSTDEEHREEAVSILQELTREATVEMTGEGADPEQLSQTWWIDARYRDQGFELRVAAEDWVEGFHRAHESRYGYRRDAVPVHAVTLRARVESPGATVEVRSEPQADLSVECDPSPCRVVWRGANLDVQVVPRHGLASQGPLAGPVIVQEYSATTWCPPGWTVRQTTGGAMELNPVMRRAEGTAEESLRSSNG